MTRNLLLLLICVIGMPLMLLSQQTELYAPFRFGQVKLQPTGQSMLVEDTRQAEFFIVQFESAIDPNVLPMDHAYYLGKNTYILRSRMQQLEWWAHEGNLKAWAEYPDKLKVHPDLRNGQNPPYLEVVLNKSIAHEKIIEAFDKSDIPLEKEYPGSSFAVIKNEIGVIDQLKKMKEVVFIHPGGRKSVPEDLRSKELHRSDLLEGPGDDDLGFDGEGVSVLVRDDGYVGPHLDFEGRLFNDPRLPVRVGGTHGDQVAGVLGAAGNVEKQGRGMAPAADIYVTNYEASFLDNTLDLHIEEEVLYTNSSYSNGCNHGYTPNAAEVDRQIYEYPTLLHIFSAGNNGNTDCEYGAGAGWGNITGGHKQAKNCIATANVNSSGQIMASSSRGPATDGRLKPEIAANGNGNYSTLPNNKYGGFGGTSGAAPCVAGVAAQLCEAYRSLYQETPASALIKAALLNSADEAGQPGPDFIYGWGLLDAYGAYQIIKNQQIFTGDITEGEEIVHQVQLPADVDRVKIMLYWADAPGAPMATKALVNDLDLKVDFNSEEYLPLVLDHSPNRFTLDNPAEPGIDTLNNVEQVVIEDIIDGVANIEVSGTVVPSGNQRYYIVYEFLRDSTPDFEWVSPKVGELVDKNSSISIEWENNISNASQKVISYSLDGGATWTDKLTFSALDYYLLRIDSVENGDSVMLAITEGSYSDTLDGPVYIASVHHKNEIYIDSICAQDAVVSWKAMSNATSYRVYTLGEKYPEVFAETTDTMITVPIGNPSESQLFAVATQYGSLWTERSDGKVHPGGLKNCPQPIELAADSIQIMNEFQLYRCGPFDLQVTVEVSNFGLQNIDSFQLCFRLEHGPTACQWFDRELISMTRDTIVIDSTIVVDSAATELEFWVDAPGDEYYYNDTITEEVNIVFLEEEMIIDSLIMDFAGNGLPALSRIVNPDNSLTWNRAFETNKENNRSTMLVMPNYFYEETGEVDMFVTPVLNLDTFTDPQLVFDYAYAGFDGFPDELIVVAAEPCDITNMDTLWHGIGLDMATTDAGTDYLEPDYFDEWGEVFVSLNEYKGQNIMIGFISVNQWGNNMYIDNVAIMPDSSYRHNLTVTGNPDDTACVDSTVQAVVHTEGSGEFVSRWYNTELGTNTPGDTLTFKAGDFFSDYVAFVSNQYYTTFAPFSVSLHENPRLSPREISRSGDTVKMRSRATIYDSVVWYGDNGVVLRGDTVTYARQNNEGKVTFEVIAYGECTSAKRIFSIDFTTSGDDAIAQKLTLYPNPSSSNKIFIEGLEDLAVQEVRIYDLQSRLISIKRISGHGDVLAIDWPQQVQSGVYFLELRSSERAAAARLRVVRVGE